MSLAPSLSLSSFISSQGFHFTVSTTISGAPSHEVDQCSIHLLYHLDPHIYADQYELAQRFDYTTLFWGTSDLEKPVSAVDAEIVAFLFTLDPLRLTGGHNITLDVPLHIRYGRPVPNRQAAYPYHVVELKRPVGFFSCEQDVGVSVPDVLHPFLSLAGWPTFSPTIITYTSPQERLEIVIPVGVHEDLSWVDVGTATVMLAMFLYVLLASIRTAARLATKSSVKTD